MLIAVLGDIHGHYPALEAVWRHIEEEGIRTVLSTGDAVAGHPWPNETVDALQAWRIVSVQGEFDREAALYPRRAERLRARWPAQERAVLEQTHQATRSDNLEFLRGLPRSRRVEAEGLAICLCHGTPSSQAESLSPHDPDTRYRRARESANADIVVCGRTHAPHARSVDGALFVNPGSVAGPERPAGSAGYAVIDTDADPWQVTFQEVAYAVQEGAQKEAPPGRA